MTGRARFRSAAVRGYRKDACSDGGGSHVEKVLKEISYHESKAV